MATETVGISPKAILAATYPAVASFVGVVINALVSGELDRAELIIAGSGVATSALAYLGAYVGAPGEVRKV